MNSNENKIKRKKKSTKITGAHSACNSSTTQPRYRSEFVEFLSYFVAGSALNKDKTLKLKAK